METYQLAALLAGYARPDLRAEAAHRRRGRIRGDGTPRARDRRERRRHRVLALPGRWRWA